ncbi:MAG: inorganic phosphate transporter [Clostridiales bacterium]|jgi:PiT family inorganic phosphate transporter|nr:inorganic phosphate transporter [Clostridiales bacterium]
MFWLLGLTALTGFSYTFITGFHDGSNIISTIVASRSIAVKKALVIACISELIGGFLFGTAVAQTMAKGLLNYSIISSAITEKGIGLIIASFVGAIVWNLITWNWGLPSSSYHALVGGMIGAAIFLFGIEAVYWKGILLNVVLVMAISPVIGFIAGFLMLWLLKQILKYGGRRTEKNIKRIQIITMVALALSYGSNDSQKSMGLISLALGFVAGSGEFNVPLWVIAGSSISLSLGMYLGGWRMVKTVGMKVFKLKPIHSFASQMATVSVLLTTTLIGMPVSTTQTITASVMGVGSKENMRRLNWNIVKKIALAWITTIPAAMLVSGIIVLIAKGIILLGGNI